MPERIEWLHTATYCLSKPYAKYLKPLETMFPINTPGQLLLHF